MYASTPSSAAALPDTMGLPALSGQDVMLRAGSDGAAGAMLDSSELLRGNKAVTIQHNGSVYRLQSTKLGKLILTK